MTKRRFNRFVDPENAYIWKKETVDYLKGLEDVPEQMEADLMAMLHCSYKTKGHLLLEPGGLHTHAHYLRSGLVGLFVEHPISHELYPINVWYPGQIVVIYTMFRNRYPNTEYYLVLMTDGELVSISNTCMDGIYAAYPAASQLTIDILADGNKFSKNYNLILQTENKLLRPELFAEYFPELDSRMGAEEKCIFLGMSQSTLTRSYRRLRRQG